MTAILLTVSTISRNTVFFQQLPKHVLVCVLDKKEFQVDLAFFFTTIITLGVQGTMDEGDNMAHADLSKQPLLHFNKSSERTL